MRWSDLAFFGNFVQNDTVLQWEYGSILQGSDNDFNDELGYVSMFKKNIWQTPGIIVSALENPVANEDGRLRSKVRMAASLLHNRYITWLPSVTCF